MPVSFGGQQLPETWGPFQVHWEQHNYPHQELLGKLTASMPDGTKRQFIFRLRYEDAILEPVRRSALDKAAHHLEKEINNVLRGSNSASAGHSGGTQPGQASAICGFCGNRVSSPPKVGQTICVQCVQAIYGTGRLPLPHFGKILADSPRKAAPLPTAAWLIGEIKAFRGWKVENGHLKSMSSGTIWAPGEPMHGKVKSNKEHCGVYAYKTVSDLLTNHLGKSDLDVYGEVSLWGDVVEHQKGYRAEWAKPTRLIGQLSPKLLPKELEDLRNRYQLAA